MSRAFELVATPAFFAGIGYLIDRAAGTEPVFLVVLAIFGVVGMFVRTWIGYDQEMRSHETSGRWVRGAHGPATGSTATTAAGGEIWSARREAQP